MTPPTKLPHCCVPGCGLTATRGLLAPSLCKSHGEARGTARHESLTEDDEIAAQKFDEQIARLVKQ